MKDNVKNQQARAVLKRRIISFPNDSELRVESIIREFEDYAMIGCKQYDKVVLQFITASVYPLKKSELCQLVSFFANKFHKAEYTWETGTDEKLGEKLLVQLLCSCFSHL